MRGLLIGAVDMHELQRAVGADADMPARLVSQPKASVEGCRG